MFGIARFQDIDRASTISVRILIQQRLLNVSVQRDDVLRHPLVWWLPHPRSNRSARGGLLRARRGLVDLGVGNSANWHAGRVVRLARTGAPSRNCRIGSRVGEMRRGLAFGERRGVTRVFRCHWA